MSTKLNLLLHNLTNTELLGKILAEIIPQFNLPFFLQGNLGAGKTTLVRFLVEALPGGELAEVSSPSFTLCNSYPTSPPILHFDLYRLENGQSDLDLEEALEEYKKQGILLIVEWPEHLPAWLLPESFLRCSLQYHGKNRSAEFMGLGKKALQVLELIAEKAHKSGLELITKT